MDFSTPSHGQGSRWQQIQGSTRKAPQRAQAAALGQGEVYESHDVYCGYIYHNRNLSDNQIAYKNILYIYIQMVCQKLCQNI